MKFYLFLCLTWSAFPFTFAHAEVGDITLDDTQINTDNESVTTSMRCPGGGIAVGGDFTASRADVALISESGVDCAAEGCSAWQMTFNSENLGPFHVKVNVQCKGVDTDKILNATKREAFLQEYPALSTK